MSVGDGVFAGRPLKWGRGDPLTGPSRSRSPGSLRQARASRSSASDGSGQQGLGGVCWVTGGARSPRMGARPLGRNVGPSPYPQDLALRFSHTE